MANNEFKYCLSGQVHPICKSFIGGNSVVFKKGDFVMLSGGFLVLATATNQILGTVEGCQTTGKAPHAMDSTPDQWTMTSDNQTVAQDEILVNVDPTQVVAVDLSAAIGTTASSTIGFHFDLTDKDTVNEGSAAAATTNSCQVTLIEQLTTTRGLFVIHERQLV